MYSRGFFKIFSEKDLDSSLSAKFAAINREISEKQDDYILNVNETEFIDFFVAKYSIEKLEILEKEVNASTYEKEISSEKFPSDWFNVIPGRSYKKDVIRYYLPFVGDEKLLHYRPNPSIMNSVDVFVEDNCICFEIINFYNDPEKIKRDAKFFINLIKNQAGHVNNQIKIYNSNLENKVLICFQNRKQHLLDKNNLVASLGVPIRKSANVPNTFTIPSPPIRKKVEIPQPNVHKDKEFKPEPTLGDGIYQQILQIVHDVGKQLERMPSTYIDKEEENLRDHFLLMLEPHFEGSATGETFNKSGKTDVLLRHEGKNVFIAECKYWKGKKVYLDTISQLLGYLTWRDSKSAVILFVKNKEFSSVIRTVEDVTPNHSNYLGFVEKKEETWLTYRFHINDDPNREVKLAVLLFHFP